MHELFWFFPSRHIGRTVTSTKPKQLSSVASEADVYFHCSEQLSGILPIYSPEGIWDMSWMHRHQSLKHKTSTTSAATSLITIIESVKSRTNQLKRADSHNLVTMTDCDGWDGFSDRWWWLWWLPYYMKLTTPIK